MNAVKQKFPKQIKYIVGNEACERFSFYGMRSILVIFMTSQLMLQAHAAKAVFHLFVSACYLLPLLGGYLSDRYLGKYKTIIYLSLIYCAGHGVLALGDSANMLYIGLALIALGTGGIKPCVSSYVGDQFTESNKSLIQKIFDVFYFSINFGAFFSTLLIPWIFAKYGSHTAFAIPGILMALATLIFWLGRKDYVNVPPTKETGTAGVLPVVFYALKNLRKKKSGQSFLEIARDRYSADEVEAVKAAVDVFKVFITISAFWSLYDQSSSSWVLQAAQMDLNVLGVKLEASQIQAINPILIMVLIPVCTYWLYPTIERVFGYTMTSLRKIGIGMFLTAFTFVISAILQFLLDHGQHLSVVWQFVPFFILTLAEIFVSITGLEFAYTQAPRSMKSTMMSFFFLTIFCGNFFTAVISKINPFETGTSAYLFYAIMMVIVSAIYALIASKYKVRAYLEKEETKSAASVGNTVGATKMSASGKTISLGL